MQIFLQISDVQLFLQIADLHICYQISDVQIFLQIYNVQLFLQISDVRHFWWEAIYVEIPSTAFPAPVVTFPIAFLLSRASDGNL